LGKALPVPETRGPDHLAARVIAEIVVASIGTVFLASALIANQRFLDRHFVPSFLLPRHWYVAIESFVRLCMVILGAWLALFARPRAGRFAARAPARALHLVMATALAIGASELALRHVHLGPAEWLLPDEEPRRRPDPQLGWTWVPAHNGYKTIGGRVVNYAIDSAGYRVNRVDEPVDPERPTILFTGESVMFGEGLTWQESVPAQVGAILGMQTANLAVHGYGNDQAYLRLQRELPHFRRPVAVVSLFMLALFGRNLDENRPHLGPGLVWLPAERRSRLGLLAKLLVPYRTDATVERGVTVTREVFCATGELARAHRTTPLLVVLQFDDEDPPEQTLQRRILDDGCMPHVVAKIDSAWRLNWDRHPDARAAHAIAVAVAAELRKRINGEFSARLHMNVNDVVTVHRKLAPHEQQEIPLQSLLIHSANPISAGSITVTQDANLRGMAVAAQLLLTKSISSLPSYVDEELAMPAISGSATLRGVADEAAGTALIAITSIVNWEQHVTLRCLSEKAEPKPATITIAPYATSVVSSCSGELFADMGSYAQRMGQHQASAIQGYELVQMAVQELYQRWPRPPSSQSGSCV
jgi:hypothetical protein